MHRIEAALVESGDGRLRLQQSRHRSPRRRNDARARRLASTRTLMFVFGEFTLDVDRRQLRLRADDIRLTPKAFDVLHLLVVHAPKVLSKETILERAWADTFVTDGSLSTVIGEIRIALADDARAARFIRTCYGVGYAFAADVVESDAQAGMASAWRLTYDDRSIALRTGTTIVGRSAEAGVMLDVPGVSRQHARLTVSADRVVIEDLRSKNGTWVGSTRVEAATDVGDGAEVRVGPVAFSLRRTRAIRSTETIATMR
jgi:DNA-binding winged helix-turn-helix (wHTH) protein